MHPAQAFNIATQDRALDYVRAYPFAVLTVWDGGRLRTAQLPLIPVFGPADELVAFEGHIARSNVLAQVLSGRTEAVPGQAVFCGPDAYVSANAYPSKAIDGRAVPTWNYIAVEAEGVLSLTSPSQTRAILERQTAVFEAGEAQPWSMGDADAAYLDRLEAAIIGLTLDVTRFEGTEKLSQNKAEADFGGVLNALEARQEPGAAALAARMKTLNRG
ncbi:FMN-binding negative transcriptional regulator [Oceanicaulis sp.]|uniref:FMN-binding negative transcriptional regulator n=1 Tax=Oceanicaulis sp. TaxID=1924941 RepID=UPI003F708FDE